VGEENSLKGCSLVLAPSCVHQMLTHVWSFTLAQPQCVALLRNIPCASSLAV